MIFALPSDGHGGDCAGGRRMHVGRFPNLIHPVPVVVTPKLLFAEHCFPLSVPGERRP